MSYKVGASATFLMTLILAGCYGNSSDTPAASAPAPGTPAYINPLGSVAAAAATPCSSSGKNAFTTYGANAFVAVNEQIFTNVLADTSGNLGSSFSKIGDKSIPATMDGLAAFKGNLAAFLVYTYGGPEQVKYTDGVTYRGPQDMAAAHVGLHITPAQYDYFLTNIVVPALTAKGVSSADVSSCFAPVLTGSSFKNLVVNDAAGTGLGANLRCGSGHNAWDTYGANAFVAVNEQIFTNVMSEVGAHGTTNLGTSFTKIGSGNPPSTSDNLAAFKGNLAAFLVYTYGGPSTLTYTDKVTYFGPQDMMDSHAGLGITSAQYDYFLTNIVVPALTSQGVPAGDVSACFAPPLLNSSFKSAIVGK